MLGVPAEIVIDVAVPAEAWPDPLPPVVHAAIATPMAVADKARIVRTSSFFLFRISITSGYACQSRQRKLAGGCIGRDRAVALPQKGAAGNRVLAG